MLRTLRTLRFSISSQLLIALVILVAGLGLSGCSQGSRKARHQAKADKAFDAGDYPQAEVEYLNLVSVDPTDAHAMARLGLIYLENGKMSRAFPFLKRAEELDGNNLQVRLKIGLLNAASGNHKAAREQALFILDKDPKYPEAPPLLAQSAKTAKDQETVRQRLDKLVTLIGPTVWTELAFGSLSVQAGKIGEAKAHIEKALALDPKCADAYYSLGTIQWLGNDLAGTERSFKQAAELSRPRSAHKLGYANFKFKTGALEAGKEVLTQVTQETPDYLPAWGSLAELALAQRNFEECTRLLNQIQARDPENYQAQVLGARLKLLQGRASEAIAVLELLTLRYPTAPQNFFQLGLAHLFTGDNAKALKYINEALALDPSYEDAILWQAQLNTQRGEAEAAIKSLQALIKRRPQLDDAYLKLAGAYAAKEDLSSAIATCRQLQNFHAESPNIPFVIGGFLLQQDKPKEARNEFLRARTLSSQFQPAFQQLVALDIHEKNFDAALNSVQKEIDLHPELPELRALRAQIWIAQTNHDEAEKDLRKALELNPNYRPAYMMLADLYVSSKRNEKALQELAAFVEKNPRDVPALMLMGMLNNERGNFSEARACYERLLEINPNFGIALNNLAYLYSEKFEMLDRAYETARKARDLAPYDPAASDTLGWILYKRGDYNWAASLLQASAEKLPDEPEVFYHLGMTYYMLNQEVRARTALTRACGAKKDFEGKDEARKRLALLSLDFTKGGPEITAALEKRLQEQADDPVALTHLAAIYETQGLREKAAELYEQVLRLNSSNPKSLINLARLYADHLNNQPKALELAKSAYKLAPNDVDIAHVLGRLVFANGQYKWALSLLQQGDARKSADADLLYNLALALYSMGQPAEAVGTMHDALMSNPNFAQAQEANQFMELVSLADDPAKAAESESLIQKTLKTDAANVPALMASAAIAQQKGNLPAAISALEQALQRYPDFTPAIKKLAANYFSTPGKEQRAYELAVKAREASPADAGIARLLGMISYQRGDFSSAVRLLKQGLANENPADARPYYYLGMAQFKLKSLSESKTSLQQAMSKNLEGPLADEARKTLALIK